MKLNPQLGVNLPIPIIEQIITFASVEAKLEFRLSCKRFFSFIATHFFPFSVSTLCGDEDEVRSDGDSILAQFCGPTFGVLDSSSTILFISRENDHTIGRIDLSTRKITTLGGTSGKEGWKDGIESQFSHPSGLALDEREKILYVSDSWNHVIRAISLIDRRVDTVYGKIGTSGRDDGIGNESTFKYPLGLALDSISNHLYVVDGNNHLIRRILLNEKRVETLCGNGKEGHFDSSFEESMFRYPEDIAFNSSTQELYLSDCYNHVIRVLSLGNRKVKTLCGTPYNDDRGSNQSIFNFPKGLGLDIASNCLFVCDTNNDVVRKISLSKEAKISTLHRVKQKGGNKDRFATTFNYPVGIVMDPNSGSFYVTDYGDSAIRKITDRSRIFTDKQ